MRYRLLGNSGLRVSEISLGTMTFGEDWGWGTPKDESKKVYDAYREAGGNFIDTANVYTNGSSETFLGEFMQGDRQSVVMATIYTNAARGAGRGKSDRTRIPARCLQPGVCSCHCLRGNAGSSPVLAVTVLVEGSRRDQGITWILQRK